MRQTQAVGFVLIVGAVVVGAALAFGLYQWESTTRARQVDLFPTATALPAKPSATPPAKAAAEPAATGAAAAPSAAAPAAQSSSGDSAAGAKTYAAQCNSCHPNGNAGFGPAVRGPAFAAKFPDDASLKKLIRDGKGSMPGFASLSESDLGNLVAYIRSLR